MKRLSLYGAVAFMLMMLISSCSEEINPEHEAQGNVITIRLQTSSLATKNTVDGVAGLNENKIETIHYFFYPEDPDDQSTDNTERPAAYWGVLDDVNQDDTRSIELVVSEGVFNKLFPRPYNSCELYTIVNLPEGISVTGKETLAQLQAKAIQAEFVTASGTPRMQELFVMQGLGTVEVVNRKAARNNAEGTIAAKRIAAKINVSVETAENVEDTETGQVWTSHPELMEVSFHNGVSNALISAEPADLITPSYFDVKLQGTSYFYTYPIKWRIGDEQEPYIKIMLPWETNKQSDEGDGQIFQTVKTYYKVILGGETVNPNTWYDIKVKLTALGNFDENPALNVDIYDVNYKVVDWSHAFEMGTEIFDARYLVVEKDEYVIDNQNTLRIPLSSSHECEIVDLETLSNVNQATVTRPNYKKQEVTVSSVSWSDSWSLLISDDGNYIEFEHTLDNDIKSKNIDFAPYTIRFRVRHKDEYGRSLYYRDVTIVQNPAMKIEHEFNPGGNIVEDPKTEKSDDKGYVFVNGNQLVGSSSSWNLVRSCLDGGNSNPNMYIISTSVPFDDYIVSDPRQTEPWTVGTGDYAPEEDVNGRKLQYYYRTVAGDESHKIIAPKFRIASSYGKCWSNISKTKALRRCSAYQERGYPAGRWRVPTLAEMRYIATLSNYGIIPKLFTDGNNYWTSDGIITYGDDMQITDATSGAVRCVYDEWYWEQTDMYKVPVDEFTWGDQQR